MNLVYPPSVTQAKWETSLVSRHGITSPATRESPRSRRHRAIINATDRAGNRRLNHALHIAAITQIRQNTPGRDLYRRKIAEGKTTKKRCAV